MQHENRTASLANSNGATSNPVRPQEVVFILGILQRSGTNYLLDLLALHPECQSLPTIGEDFLVAYANRLEGYVRNITQRWNPAWDADGSWQQSLREHLGKACISFLTDKAREIVGPLPKYLATKSPCVENLALYPIFPHARVIVIIRDGRDLIASGMKAFQWSFEKACRSWVQAAREIIVAKEAGLPFLLVRYEDLLKDLKAEMSRIFAFLEMDAGLYNQETAAQLPVRGSSVFGTDHGQVNWKPMAKTSDFNPLGRWADWSRAKCERFSWLARRESAYFGYDLPTAKGWRLWWNSWNRLLDLNSFAGRFAAAVWRQITTRTGRLFLPSPVPFPSKPVPASGRTEAPGESRPACAPEAGPSQVSG